MNQSLAIPEHVQRLRGARFLAQEGQEGLSSNPVPYLSIKSSRFTATDAVGAARPVGAMDQRGMYLDVLIVDLNPARSKTYYAEAFDPSAEDFKPPTCFSDNGVGPSHRVANPPALTCASCPLDVWGSKVSENGKEVKFCNDSKKIALLLADGTTIPFRLNIPPASLKAWKNHCQTIAANGAELTMLVTRLRFDPQATGPVLTFEAITWVSPEQASLIEATLADDQKLAALVGRDDKPKQVGTTVSSVMPPATTMQHQPTPTHVAPYVAVAPAQTPTAPEPTKTKRIPRTVKPAEALPPASFMSAPPAAPVAATYNEGVGVQEAPPAFLQRAPAPLPPPSKAPPPIVFGMVQQPQVSDSALDNALTLALGLPVT